MKSVKGVKKDLEYYMNRIERTRRVMEKGGVLPKSFYRHSIDCDSAAASALKSVLGESL